MTTAQPHCGAARLCVWALAEEVCLLVWEGPTAQAAARYRPLIDGRPARPPFAHLALPTANGGERHLLAVRIDADTLAAASLAVAASDDGDRIVAVGRGDGVGEADPLLLLGGLGDAGRCKFARFALETVASLFKLAGSRTFAAFALALFRELFDRPGRALPHCRFGERAVVAQCEVPARLGERVRGVIIAADGVRQLPAAAIALVPAAAGHGRHAVCLLLPASALHAGAAIILLGDDAVAGRLLAPRHEPLPAVAAWLAAGSEAAQRLAPPLIDAAARLAVDDEQAAGLARELGRVAAGDVGCGVSGHIDLVAAGDAGLFVSGSFEDRWGLIEGLACERLGRTEVIPTTALSRLPGAGGDGPQRPASAIACASAFAAVLPWGELKVPLASVKLSLLLKSGSLRPLWQGQPTPADGQSLERVLALLAPAEDLPARSGSAVPVATVAGPWLRAEQGRRISQVAAHELIPLGAPVPDPEIGLVLPLADEAPLLRCTLTAMALASSKPRFELIVVADRARLGSPQVQLLRGLMEALALRGQLVVIDQPAGEGSLLNGGAVATRAPLLGLMGAAISAEAVGWLDVLADRWQREGANTLVACRVLAEDESIADAGLMVGIDERGEIALAGRYQGFPRGWPEAADAAVVDAVSVSALLLARVLFERAGGFDDRFFTARYRAADFCCEVRRQGGRVLALPAPVVFDVGGGERARSAGAEKAAAAVDRQLFAERWPQPEKLAAVAAERLPPAAARPVGVAA